MTARDVIEGRARFSVECSDAVAWLDGLPADSVDLCFFSPPYSGARLYLEGGQDLGIARDTEAWVAWMVEVFRQCVRVCKGLVACVCDDQTRDYRYGCGPYLLMADLCRAGFNLRRPCVYRRSGIPGSGGPDWFRSDHEPIVCVTRPGRLPWSDTTACGHPPKWAPGGEMSNRQQNGRRVNQWGQPVDNPTGSRKKDGCRHSNVRPSHRAANTPAAAAPEVDLFGEAVPEAEVDEYKAIDGRGKRAVTRRRQNGVRQNTKPHTKAKPNGTDEQQEYTPPVLANPGTCVERLYTAREVAELLGGSDVVDVTVGGGQMGEGDRFSRVNEAPFPEELCERFVLSFAAPDSVVCDPFAGSGTTLAVAVRNGRRAVGCDLRQSQADLALRRLSTETPLALFAEDAPARNARGGGSPGTSRAGRP